MSEELGTMTVAELVEALQEFPPDARVFTPGHCGDCGPGYIVRVRIDRDGDVTIYDEG